MAKREVAFPGLSGFLAFGAGVAVGANWPRASNFVGFILQRLGFELTDLALWMWDPEKSLAQEAEITPVKRAKTKRAQALAIQDDRPISKRVGAKVKAKTKTKAGSRGRRRAPGTANVSTTQPERVTIRTTGMKSKRATVKTERKTSSNGRSRKIRTFPDIILPAEAALN